MTQPRKPDRDLCTDLVTLMRRHQFRGIPARVATTIKTADTHQDRQTLNEWIPRAIAQMLQDQR